MANKIISTTSNFLTKVDSFKYFLLISTFTMMLDSALIYYKGISLLEVNWSYINKNITIGSVLVFFSLFSLFITFVVTAISKIICSIYLAIPNSVCSFFNQRSPHSLSRGDYVSMRKLESFAIKNNNAIAYAAVKEKHQDLASTDQLKRYSLSFLVASFINWFIGNHDTSSVMTLFLQFSDKPEFFSVDILKEALFSILYLMIAYFGIARSCGILSSGLNEYDVYIDNHKIG